MLIEYEDGHKAGTCSINCIAIDIEKNAAKKIISVKVADYRTNDLIDAKRAIWVMGGSKKGVMTKLPKWAFANKDAAQGFIKEYGGKIATYDIALAEASKDKMPGKKKAGDSGHGGKMH
jgi:nitrous oxide reductase accessory protein NosL